MILTALTACDNVRWEGVEVRLEPPPPAADTPAAAPVEEPSEGPAPLELGPVLYAVERGDDGPIVLPVAELGDDGRIAALPIGTVEDFGPRFRRQRMTPGTRLTLFASGVRAGILHLTGEAPPDTTLCAPRPRARGRIQVVPEAADAERFVALEAEGGDVPLPGDYRPRVESRDERIASLNLAAAIFNRLQAPWPADLVSSRADIQVFRPGGLPADSPAIAATFLFRDRMAMVEAPDAAWSIFFVGEPGPDGYEDRYVRYRTVGEEGKGIPRFFEHGDWDGDGGDEVLLEVLGAERRWFSALDRGPDGWSGSFEEPCGRASAVAGVPGPAGGAQPGGGGATAPGSTP